MRTAFEPAGRIVRGNTQVCYNPKHKCKTCEHFNQKHRICQITWVENCDHYFRRVGGRKGCLYRMARPVEASSASGNLAELRSAIGE